ncbi:hypothetical protein OWM54_20385 [Myxococcus sp. MISCRS1]|uniref:hypothetical protein n=1 Tax=Myxococcus TaxID=32 RepID=UPI001D3B34B4|nr:MULTISPECIES: hypothetical protein [Myxococcus]BDT38644.1 hypothetical protein MFMH1_83130 [Myxococcus sp. MH1]MBZ4399001.1 hypothetical protein [Myxococcus sp. AS-1-15]MBZ4413402.1 hypothetical protein [Myxococcus sp. XM-1-1-1]MCP3063583.1 hypothetical protein [Myxococcus guangdongensis]MCY0999495.1 hypothetical protein [Myxococcus sp. MISCRS1]
MGHPVVLTVLLVWALASLAGGCPRAGASLFELPTSVRKVDPVTPRPEPLTCAQG